ncbi:M15 family metallopeptidase [uncultured Shewanella sp.]|uniref:M15 family metallopeptidase n=1 Tax=uncultured Shewanella sp. TaxID=173975 RepID=UPI002622239D|nr:M15 family metallopeptidase [uncultured Shewanella sp.]
MLYTSPINHKYLPATPAECTDLQNKNALIQLTESSRLKFDKRYLKAGHKGAFLHFWVRESLAIRLIKIINKLPNNRGIMVFDTLRNSATSMAIFETIKTNIALENPELTSVQLEAKTRQFCAHPTDKSHYAVPPHQSGGAIDLALFDTFSSEVLDYGCDFDDLTQVATTSYFEQESFSKASTDLCSPLNEKRNNVIKENRRYLFNIMKAHGFVNYSGEWWHYGIGDCIWAKYKNQNQYIYDNIADSHIEIS